jgi:hypothetical protein
LRYRFAQHGVHLVIGHRSHLTKIFQLLQALRALLQSLCPPAAMTVAVVGVPHSAARLQIVEMMMASTPTLQTLQHAMFAIKPAVRQVGESPDSQITNKSENATTARKPNLIGPGEGLSPPPSYHFWHTPSTSTSRGRNSETITIEAIGKSAAAAASL